MHFIVTGATGFIGRAVVRAALVRGHAVTAIVRDAQRAQEVLGAHDNFSIVHAPSFDAAPIETLLRGNDRLVHLAWGDVGKYTDPKNFLENISPQFFFLERAAKAGLTHQTIAGSCLEYGKIEGQCTEDMPLAPACYYGLAKKTLYDTLGLRKAESGMQLNWLRYFYVYGQGQRAMALLPQLQAAIARGDETFNMSQGDQERDFVHVDTVAHNTVVIAEQPNELGAVNVGNGTPVRVDAIVEAAVAAADARITLNKGFYGYPGYEPFSFYADTKKLMAIEGIRKDDGFVL